MRMTDPLHFTENHRFTIYRDFSLSPLDLRMLSIIYQPMVGAYATSLYLLLNQQLPAERIGYTAADQLRKLFLSLGTQPNERGRKLLIEQCSKLEAVGLLHTFRTELSQTEEYIYELRLSAPLKPADFFQTQHLLLLLRDKIGKYPVIALREDLEGKQQPDVDDPYGIREELSMPFYEIFSLDSQTIDLEFEQSSTSSKPNKQVSDREYKEAERLQYGDIIRRFPKNSANRPHVEKLKEREDDLVLINYLAEKYRLNLKEMCQLLDEEGVFTSKGKLLGDQLEHKANETFLQSRKREENVEWSSLGLGQAETSRTEIAATAAINDPAAVIELKVPDWLVEQFDAASYNKLLSTEPHTQVLRVLVAPNISRPTLNLFSKLNLYYRLPDAVLNVLVHHIRTTKLPWKENYIEKMAASLQGEQILTFAQAVEYFRKESEARSGIKPAGSVAVAGKASKSMGRTGAKQGQGSQKPKMPVYNSPAVLLTSEEEEELESIVRQLDNR